MATKEQREAFLATLCRLIEAGTDNPLRLVDDADLEPQLGFSEGDYDACWRWWSAKGIVERFTNDSVQLTVAGVEHCEAAFRAADDRPMPSESAGRPSGPEKKVLIALLREKEAHRPDALSADEIAPRARLATGAAAAALHRLELRGLVRGVNRIKPATEFALTDLGVLSAEDVRRDQRRLMALATSVVAGTLLALAGHLLGIG